MSLLSEYLALQESTTAGLARMKAIEADEGFQREREFETAVRGLLGEYNKSLRDVIALLDPEFARGRRTAAPVATKQTRRARTAKVYRNPHTDELLETKGGNNLTMKRWKEQWSAEEIASWLQD